MKLMWPGYLVYSLGNCAMKLCIETDLTEMQLMPFFSIDTINVMR
jgi:non-homologous end joining protein Ku